MCSQLCYQTAANQWTLVEIELLATVGWKWGCQPFSFPCSQNVKHCRKEIYSTCLFKTSIPAVPFWNSKHPVFTRSRFLRAQYPPPVLQYGCIMNHARPFVATSEKIQSHAEKQRVWSRSCGLQELLRTIQGLCPRFGLQDIDCALSCDTWLLQTNEIQCTIIVEIDKIDILASVGWKWGCQPFSFPCSQNVKHCRKEIYSTCLFKTSIPAVPFWNSKHPVSTRSRFLRATVRSTSSALCLHHVRPIIAATEKYLSHAEKQRVWSRSCGHQDLLQWSVCALSCGMRLLQTNEHLSRLSF